MISPPPRSSGERVFGVESFGYLFAVATVLFTVIGLGTLVPQAIRGGPNGPGAFLVRWFAILGWFWFNILRIPSQVTLTSDGWLRFQALVRRVEVHASDVRSVRGLGLNSGAIIEFSTSRIWLRVRSRETFDFLTLLRSINPVVEIRRI